MPSNSAPIPVAASGVDSDLPGTTDEDRRQRRRVQNRVNQRARRARVQESVSKNPKKQKQPYQTARWRLDELEPQKPNHVNPTQKANPQEGDITLADCLRIPATQIPIADKELRDVDVELYGQRMKSKLILLKMESPDFSNFDLYSDHLLHLTNYNVLRGLYANKCMLSKLTKFLSQGLHRMEEVDIMKRFPGNTVMVSPTPGIPPCLTPTPLQMRYPHATWIDMIPFPTMRDNLIINHEQFNHWEFTRDIFGDLLENLLLQKSQIKDFKLQALGQLLRKDRLDNELTAHRKGLILWGEPYRPEDWEATPYFFMKWDWVVDGCDELIKSTNHWRMLRHEQPLQFVRTTER